MKSKRSHEGYLLIDNRNSPGISNELAHSVGPDLPVSFGRGLFEAPTITCSHCQVVVVLRPDRTRDRPYCPKCDHYICDKCAAIRAANGGECKTYKQIVDEIQEQAAIAPQGGSLVITS